MQLFSRKKAILALSLGALSVLGACGDDVTVPVVDQITTVSITPQSVNLNIGEATTLAVQITGGSATNAPTLASCTSSNASVATATVASGACRVTAVAAGNATVTARSSTGQEAAAAVQVAAAQNAVRDLTVSPTTANVAVGQTITIVPNVTRAGNAVTTTFAYATSNAAVATVNATTGAVTAVAPGVATITVTATGSGTGFTTTSLTTGVTVNVSNAPPGVNTLTVSPTSTALAVGATSPLAVSSNQPAGAPAAVITYGSNAPTVATVSSTGVITGVSQGNAVITVTATSPAGNGFAASTLTQLVQVVVSPPAQVSIANITQGTTNNPVDIQNIQGQIQVQLNVTPNGQNIQSVQVYICDANETDAQCTAPGRRIAAQQAFTGSTANVAQVNLFVNTAEFDGVDFASGANANTFYKNGLKRVIATATAGGATLASNIITSLNFTNIDGFAVNNTWRPANRAQGQDGFTYYGGPDTPDSALAGATSGTGRITVVPVLYTAARDIRNVTLALDSDTTNGFGNFCGTAVVDSVRPFSTTYGTLAASAVQTSLNINCTNASSLAPNALPQVTPAVINSQDNNNDQGPIANRITLVPNVFPVDFRLSSFYRPTAATGYEAIALDYRGPSLGTTGSFAVSGLTTGIRGGNTNPDSGFVNGAFAFANVFSCNQTTGAGCFGGATGVNATAIGDDGVGLPVLASRNTSFSVFNASQLTFSTATGNPPIFTGAPVAVGNRTSTVSSIGLGEAADLTNGAFVLRISETDRLGNRSTTQPTAGTFASSVLRFGVDLTPPVVVVIPNTGAGSNPNIVRSDLDSVYSLLPQVGGTTQVNAANAVFGVRFTDSRSGFFNCNVGVNCPAAGAGLNRGGTYQITRRRVNPALSLTNDALVENLVSTTTAALAAGNNAITAAFGGSAGTFSADPAVREFYVPIFGVTATAPTALQPTISPTQAGYYTFTGTLSDRAGNTTTITQRSVAIDNAQPQITGLSVPPILQGGTTVAFGPTGTDDLEVISGDLGLRYPNLGRASGGGAVVANQATIIRFRRVPYYGASYNLGLFHNPFQAITDNKLATPVGPGLLLGSQGLAVPMPFLQSVQTVDNTNAPLAPASVPADVKPDSVVAYLYDIRATVDVVGGKGPLFADSGMSIQRSAPIFPGQVTAPTTAVNFTATGTGALGIASFQAFNALNPGSVEFRVTTSTVVTNPPFTRVDIIRQVGAGANAQWEYLGQATFAGTLDQGATRFFRYTFTSSGVNQGQFAQTALSNGDIIRAIGSDVNGNGLSTLNTLVGQANAIGGTVTTTPAVQATFTNAGPAQVVTLSVTPATTANVVFGCSSNSTFLTATMTSPTQCTLTPNGVVAPANSVPVTVTFTATGSQAGSQTNTITSAQNTTRTP